MEHDLSLPETLKQWHGKGWDYVIGFFGSLILTGASFFLVWAKVLSGTALVITLVVLGLAQGILQLLFFLHIGKEARPRWETLIFLFMVMVLLIIAIGSLWIMYDLNHRVM